MSSQKTTRKYKVYLYVYDLSYGAMNNLSPYILGCNVNGLWHSSIVIGYKPQPTECYFSNQTGMSGCRPGRYNKGMKPTRKIYMGLTEIKPAVFIEYIRGIEHRYRSIDYSLTRHNCNSFSNELCQFLLGKEIPDYIKNICTEVLNTPTGQEIKPVVEFCQDIADGCQNLLEMLNNN
ncbi:uncharacterized protein METZ01_LOCUS151133 [marine metagenome]|uniref:PPPDE domain-containing protein n=1 Tax=marine metagenome TaxID=408172 RepID=A0A382AA60_9ZZZZ|tara:strand:+ start:101 stop:631 length:531 start_codon:yes stop_codon:yes gene_type:complete